MFSQKHHRVLRDRLFDGFQDRADLVGRLPRMQKDVGVLGHDHVGPEGEVAALPSPIKGLDEPCAGEILREQRPSSMARESQLMSMTGLVPASSQLAMGKTFAGHAFILRS